MKRVLFMVAALVLVAGAASAAPPVQRDGVDYSGVANPTGCHIAPDVQHPRQLDAKCRNGNGPARIRYRFLKDVGSVQAPASIAAEITTWVGEECTAKWMVPKRHNPARTLRIFVPKGSYCDIYTVRWSQP